MTRREYQGVRLAEEVAMRLSFFFKLCGLFVQTKSPNALRALLWAGHRG